MPFHIDRTSRRSFVRTSIGVGVSLLTMGCLSQSRFAGWGERAGDGEARRDDPEHWALLSDPHIAADASTVSLGVNMADHLRRATGEVLEMHPAPAGVIINGDCARNFGRAADYVTFRQLGIEPFAARELPVHLTLGNHDHRERFCSAFAESDRPVDGRLVSVVRGRHANFFLLDTLDKTGRVSGKMGRQQLAWLDAALATNAGSPAIVVGHHPRGGDEVDFIRKLGSLRDGRYLWDVLQRHPQVKAYVYGHTHRWDVTQRDGIYLINLPATSFGFDPGQPTGWVSMALNPSGASLRFHRIGGGPVAAGSTSVTLEWAQVATHASVNAAAGFL